MIKLRDYQSDAIESIYIKWRTKRKIVLWMNMGAGKCLSPNTLVMMYDGSSKMAKDVVVGDFLINEKSEKVKVLSTISGRDNMYKIKPKIGDGFICTKDHVLTLRKGYDNYIDIRADEFYKKRKTLHYYKYCYSGIDCFEQKQTLVDPYVMGCWLGDGSSYHATMYCPDNEVCDAFKVEAEKYGINVTEDFSKENCRTIEAYTKHDDRFDCNPFWRNLSEGIEVVNGKNVKKIPESYLKNSKKIRLQLLSGLLDTDGYLHNGAFEIIQKHKNLANQIKWLCFSLGFMCKISEKIVNGVTYYRMSITGNTDEIPTRVPRKQAGKRKQPKNPLNTSFEIEDVGYGDFNGFKVEGGRFLLADFTVTHNSEIAAYLAQDCLQDGMPMVMVVRGRELVKNLSERLDKYKINHSVFMAGHHRFDKSKLIQICSIDTMKSRDGFPFSDRQCVVLLDEAHKSYDIIFEKYRTQYILGLTATPFSDMSEYDDYVCPIEPYELRDMGVLVPEKIYAPHVMDTSSLKIVAGDFKRDQVEQLVTNGEIVGNVIEDYVQFGGDRPSVCFAVSVEHSKQLRDAFNARGIKSVHCDASSSDDERKQAKKGLEDGKIKVVCNVDIFSVGWDCPIVGCIILARPTWSLIWYLQAVGRGLRAFNGKCDCIILDNAGNVFRHGTPYRPRNISLDKPEKKTKKDYNPDEAVRTCMGCYAVYESKLINCPYCGEAPPIREIKKIEGKLALYNETEDERRERIKHESQTAYHKLLWVARKRNLSQGWIRNEIQKKYGTDVMPYIDDLLTKSKLRR